MGLGLRPRLMPCRSRRRAVSGRNERHVAPPGSSQAAAETHGALDAAFGTDGEPAARSSISCRRGEGTLNDGFVIHTQIRRSREPARCHPHPINRRSHPERYPPRGLRFIASPIPGADLAAVPCITKSSCGYPICPIRWRRRRAVWAARGKKDRSFVLEESTTPSSAGTLQSRSGDQQLLPQQADRCPRRITKIDFAVRGRNGPSWSLLPAAP